MTWLELRPETRQVLLDATAHDQLPLIPDVVGSIRSLCSMVLMAIGGDL